MKVSLRLEISRLNSANEGYTIAGCEARMVLPSVCR